MKVNLNSDLGESFGAWNMGDDAAMLAVVTTANVACGWRIISCVSRGSLCSMRW